MMVTRVLKESRVPVGVEEWPSIEEQNELGRSVKRKKDARETGEVQREERLEELVPQSEDRVKRMPTSYKERLLGKISGTFQDCFFSEDGVDEEGMDEDIEEGEDSTPMISLSKEDRERIRSQWKSSIIVKLFGSEVSYGFLEPKLRILWKINGGWELISLGHGFFLVRFSCVDDCARVIRGGPWFIQGRFLAMRRWEPNFRALEASVSVVAVWIRLPELPIEYYDIDMLNKIGSAIGPVLRVDSATLSGQRGQFARLCVQLNMEKSYSNIHMSYSLLLMYQSP